MRPGGQLTIHKTSQLTDSSKAHICFFFSCFGHDAHALSRQCIAMPLQKKSEYEKNEFYEKFTACHIGQRFNPSFVLL